MYKARKINDNFFLIAYQPNQRIFHFAFSIDIETKKVAITNNNSVHLNLKHKQLQIPFPAGKHAIRLTARVNNVCFQVVSQVSCGIILLVLCINDQGFISLYT